MNKQNKRLKIIFIILFTYVFAQFFWWAVLIIKLNKIIYAQHEKLNYKIWMIIGEGSVFSILLLAGFFLVYRFYQKELELTNNQRNFMQAVTHETKTPVAAIRLLLQTLKKHKIDSAKQEQIIDKAIQETYRLQQLTENVLTVTGFNENNIQVNIQKQNLSSFIYNLLTDLKQGIGQNHKTTINIQDNIFCKFDANALQTIITNLYDNAVKYSPVQTEIIVNARQENNYVIVEIIDKATPIPDKMKNKIFDKFYRLGNEDTRMAKGTGLGLYIVKHWARIMKATVEVIPQGDGNTFVLKLSA